MQMEKSASLVIAVDGPAAAGKTTASTALSRAFGMNYLESGRAYRSLAFEALRRGVNPADSFPMIELCARIIASGESSSLLDAHRYPASELRSPQVTRAVSEVARIAELRSAVTRLIHSWASAHERSIVEGRDIGTVVFPAARIKFYLTATPEVRAARRVAQEHQDYPETLADVLRRDHIDMTRAASPLIPADDARVIDTTYLTIEQAVGKMSDVCADAGLRAL